MRPSLFWFAALAAALQLARSSFAAEAALRQFLLAQTRSFSI